MKFTLPKERLNLRFSASSLNQDYDFMNISKISSKLLRRLKKREFLKYVEKIKLSKNSKYLTAILKQTSAYFKVKYLTTWV